MMKAMRRRIALQLRRCSRGCTSCEIETYRRFAYAFGVRLRVSASLFEVGHARVALRAVTGYKATVKGNAQHQRARRFVENGLRNLCEPALQLPKRHIFARRTLKPLWELNACLDDAFITVLRDITSSSALSKHCKIFLGHKQPVLGQLWHLLFQIIHYLGVWDMVGQMSEQVPEHFRAHDLMNPYLGPSLSLQVDIAK